ncbi:hypothetical protein SAMN05192569_101950 [Parageobacillus thermantarcticus]|uniref:Uncharacterized protein n=1 Tax=Parageobacillus thermantarcticus TaxID=186116 RepID=A0A1I0TBC4_9BACL|nr:hypothetical protein SAMN05192569_101950 [Parageobacillus thermantarcticus]
MKQLKITNDHEWTPRKLRKEERKIKNVSLRQRVMAVRLVMERYLQRGRFHAQSVPPKRSVLCILIQRRRTRSPARSETSAGPGAVFDAGTATGTETDHLAPHLGRTRLRYRFFLEHSDHSVLHSRALRGDHVPGRYS